jgi:hypothetical protein
MIRLRRLSKGLLLHMQLMCLQHLMHLVGLMLLMHGHEVRRSM